MTTIQQRPLFIKQGTLTEYELHRYAAEASELRLAPGAWPTKIETDMGNGQPFIAESRLADGGVRYRQSMGCIFLSIFND
jgi:hypothetical protein